MASLSAAGLGGAGPIIDRLRSTRRGIACAAVVAAGLALGGCAEMWPSLDASDPDSGTASEPVRVVDEDGDGSADSSGSDRSGGDFARSADAMQSGRSGAADGSEAGADGRRSGVSVGETSAASVESAEASRDTFVGKKVSQMQEDLRKLSQNVDELEARKTELMQRTSGNADRYHALLAQVTSRLQRGTTPGNPVLVEYWNQAQSELESIAETVPRLTQLSNDASDEAAFGQYLLNSVQATYGLSGAVEQDHIRLRRLEDGVHQQVVEIDRLLTDLSQDINRQNTYVNNERQNMTTLSLAIKNGDLYGTSLATRSFQQTENTARQAARSGSAPGPGDRPLVIIKFDRENVEYQQALYDAVSKALERKPEATFDLVAVSPGGGSAAQEALNTSAARRNAEKVLRTLTDMGVPSSRVQLLSSTSSEVDANEVRLYVR